VKGKNPEAYGRTGAVRSVAIHGRHGGRPSSNQAEASFGVSDTLGMNRTIAVEYRLERPPGETHRSGGHACVVLRHHQRMRVFTWLSTRPHFVAAPLENRFRAQGRKAVEPSKYPGQRTGAARCRPRHAGRVRSPIQPRVGGRLRAGGVAFRVLCLIVALLSMPALSEAIQKPIPRPTPRRTPKPTPKPAATPEVIPAGIDVITVKTLSAENPEVPFYVRPPSGFSPGDGGRRRLLLIFPFVPEKGYRAIGRNSQLVQLADKRGWFIASPSLNVDFKKDSRDRSKAFYYPERWSGKAVLDAVAEIAKKYPVDDQRLFVQGLSGGAQIAHRLALWCPDRIEAVAVNSSGWFDDPGPTANRVAWAVTVGESDQIMPESIAFVEKLKARGARPLFKTYIGMVHEDYPPANEFCAAFLAHMDDETKEKLGTPKVTGEPSAYNGEGHHPFLGDRRDYLYFPKESGQQIPEESLFFLPDEPIAKLWGDPGN